MKARRTNRKLYYTADSFVTHYSFTGGVALCGQNNRRLGSKTVTNIHAGVTCKRCLKVMDRMNLNVKQLHA